MRAVSVLLSLAICSSALLAVESAMTPGPGSAPRPPSQGASMMMQRPSPAYEVEALQVTLSDTASLGRWAELAAKGYHVVSATAVEGGKQVLFMERMYSPGQQPLVLPQAVERDAAMAESLRSTLMTMIQERQRPQRGPQPLPSGPQLTPVPVPVPVPAPKQP